MNQSEIEIDVLGKDILIKIIRGEFKSLCDKHLKKYIICLEKTISGISKEKMDNVLTRIPKRNG